MPLFHQSSTQMIFNPVGISIHFVEDSFMTNNLPKKKKEALKKLQPNNVSVYFIFGYNKGLGCETRYQFQNSLWRFSGCAPVWFESMPY